jgi:hypothetical protein
MKLNKRQELEMKIGMYFISGDVKKLKEETNVYGEVIGKFIERLVALPELCDLLSGLDNEYEAASLASKMISKINDSDIKLSFKAKLHNAVSQLVPTTAGVVSDVLADSVVSTSAKFVDSIMKEEDEKESVKESIREADRKSYRVSSPVPKEMKKEVEIEFKDNGDLVIKNSDDLFFIKHGMNIGCHVNAKWPESSFAIYRDSGTPVINGDTCFTIDEKGDRIYFTPRIGRYKYYGPTSFNHMPKIHYGNYSVVVCDATPQRVVNEIKKKYGIDVTFTYSNVNWTIHPTIK